MRNKLRVNLETGEVDPWPRLPRKTKKLLDRNDPHYGDSRGYWKSKEHRRDRKRFAQYIDRVGPRK